MRTTLTQDLNVIINCAASLDFDAPLDTATRINVTGPLLLMKLAEESPCFEAFLQLSTAFVNADKTGYIEERLYDTNVSW
jgi:dTDP-4-dehydrorhamnose reductase